MEKVAEYLRNTITDKMTLKDIVDIFENACQPMNEDDMILFETETYSFTGEELFYFSLVKQVPTEDIDMNRCFPYGTTPDLFVPYTSQRNYTGSKAMMAQEALALSDLIKQYNSKSGKNILWISMVGHSR